MATDSESNGFPDGDPEQAQAVLDFLATAPAPARAWADQQAEHIRIALLKPEAAADPEVALAELGESEEHRPRVHTPADRPERRPDAAKRRSVLVPIFGMALLVGVIYGIYRIGLPANTPETAPSMTAAPQASADDAARIQELEAALATNPDDVQAGLELGVLYFSAERHDEAAQLWLHVAEVAPDEPEAWYNLGFYYFSQAPPDEAAGRAAWEKVLEVAPNSGLAETVASHLGAFASASPEATDE